MRKEKATVVRLSSKFALLRPASVLLAARARGFDCEEGHFKHSDLLLYFFGGV